MTLFASGKSLFRVLTMTGFLAMATACGGGTETDSSSVDSGNTGGNGGGLQSVTIATNPVGSAFNALGNGLASVITNHSDFRASVQPSAGANAWAPSIDRGDVALGVANGPELIWGFRGEQDFEEPLKNIRLLVRGNYIDATGAVVRQDSGIETVRDLAGRRVAAEYPGSLIGKQILEAALVANGLDWDDVNKVPAPTITAGIEALQDNRADGAFAMVPSSPIMQEAHNAVGLHALHFLDDYSPSEIDSVPQEITDIITERVPSARLTAVEPVGYQEEVTVGIEYPSMMIGSKELSNEQAYEIMEVLWEYYEELHPVHVWFKQWSPEIMFDPNPEIPYHEGAVEFFKDKGLWNDEVEAIQQELLEFANS